MAKQLKYSEEAREKILKGVQGLAKAVATTLGPKGRNVALDKKWGAPSIVHDGVSVAKEIDLPDPFENMGAQMVKEAASKTNDDTGDGTTTATVIAEAVISEGIKNITAGANPMLLKKGIERGVEIVVGELKKMKKDIKRGDIEKVASISAGDVEIGKKIAEALGKEDRVVTVEDGKGLTIDIEYKEGMEFDKGYASAYFVTNPEKMEAEIEDAYILLTDKKISSIQELLPFLEKFVKVSKNLVIIADEIEGEALATLVVNKMRGTFNVLAIKAPGFGDRRKEMLEDIAILTGGMIISEDTGRTFESVEVEDLGQADKVWADKENARIIGGKGKKADIEARVALLRKQISDTDTADTFDKEKLEERLAKLTGGVAQINVGAATEIELNEKKERVKDAVGATKAAIEEGIVPGGGIALLDIAQEVNDKHLENAKAGDDELTGLRILKDAIKQPFVKLMENAGYNGEAMEQKVKESPAHGMGINIMSGNTDIVDMVKEGIIDPVKVVRSAVQNAASVGAIVLTTEALVTDLPEEKKETPPNPGMEY